MTGTLLAMMMLGGLSNEAHATRAGGGLNVGTMVMPGLYPVRFPNQVRNNEDTGIEKIRGDGHFGLEGAYFLGDEHRIGAAATLGFGSGYFDRSFMLKYDYVIGLEGAEVLLGGGLGVGRNTFNGEDTEQLDLPYYPLRVEAGPMLNQGFLAEQVMLYAQYNIPSRGTYTGLDGVEVDAGPGVFMTIGAELIVMFGNFER